MLLSVNRCNTLPSVFEQTLIFAALALLALSSEVLTNEKHKEGKGKGKKKPIIKKKVIPDSVSDKATHYSSADPVFLANSVTLFGEGGFMQVEDYERHILDMVNQLKNSSSLADNKCEVNLRLWMSNRRSLSPWSYSINHDDKRVPSDIPEAHCLCTGCINPFTMQEDRTMSSVPIYTKIPVKRLLCNTSRSVSRHQKKKCHSQKYKTVMENIAIGCTCIF
ncbi:interleukin-17B [Protopterus annectens]|uniref:interleukin-17B n=1 Tax=Protopterus annectens TaxID=7888 RepID=UPI001CFC209C|nr:interleukin-17B [Protopterus annectens]